MINEEIKIRETTQTEISGHLVFVGNVFDEAATVAIYDLASQQERSETVSVGSEISLGANRYSVVNLEEGKSQPGSLTLRRNS